MDSLPIRLALLVVVLPVSLRGGDSVGPLKLDHPASGWQLRLDRAPLPPVGGTAYKLSVQSSTDLQTWSDQGQLGITDAAPPSLLLDTAGPHQFFRLQSTLQDAGVDPDGADLFGYNRIFQQELAAVGYLTPEAFAATNQPAPDYLQTLSFDPTTAKYWDAFAADPAVVNAGLPPGSTNTRLYDFRLNEAELATFKTNGFVVSERMGSYSFADLFYRVFADDFPVFISADSVLHAWHFSYERLLEESEELQLAPALQQILDGMHGQLAGVGDAVRSGPLHDSLTDADYYLAVARSLLSGTNVSTIFDQDKAVADTLKAINDLQFVLDFPIFGTNRMFDFSQFTVRGHYDRTENLARYFRAYMWTARVDFRMLAAAPDAQSVRELGTAVVLTQLMQGCGQADTWRQLDDTIRMFVGRPDAMTFAQLFPLVQAAGIKSLDAITNGSQLIDLDQRIIAGNLGVQLIVGDAYLAPFGPEQLQLPRAFVLTGQRFNADGWALGKVIYDTIRWDEDIPGYTLGGKVIRRYCSALDMAYSALGNRQAGWEIARRMVDSGSRTNFRDGLPYAHNLVALTRTFDQLPSAAWEESIYARWLAALRELSSPTTSAQFPEAMRTKAWAMRTLNTQLASYTELKHDTVLYAKQPYTTMITCEYPAGFVEPVPGFWHQMALLARSTSTNLARLVATNTLLVGPDPYPWPFPWVPPNYISVDAGERQTARVNFCEAFANQMGVLEIMAAKELQQQPFSDFETAIIRGTMNRQDRPYSGPTYDGWYPQLFYKDYGQLLGGSWEEDSNGSNKSDPLVTDIHTAPPDEVDPVGGVLHEATGNIDLLMIAIDHGPDRMVYAGPLLSHYEFIVPGPVLTRLTDSDWQGRLASPPTRPGWTRSYLIPK